MERVGGSDGARLATRRLVWDLSAQVSPSPPRSKMCLYLSAQLDILSVANTIYLIDHRPTPYTGVDYSAPATAVLDSVYAQTAPHPSELVVGDKHALRS